MSRVFLMKWYHFSVEYFEDLRNVNHCEFLIMRKKEDSGKYILENNLRTWSELKRERMAALQLKEKAEKEKGTSTSPSSTNLNGQGHVSEKDKEKERKLLGDAATSASPVQTRKKWGGCPNGCDHSKHYYKKENSMHAMQLNGKPSPSSNTAPLESLAFRRPNARRWQSSSDDDEDDPRGHNGQSIDVQKSLDEVISSPDGTPSFISVEDRLRSRLKSPRIDNLLLVKHAGRDFGGSASGNTSQAGSDTEFSAEEDTRKGFANGRKVGEGLAKTALGDSGKEDRSPYAGSARREESKMGRGAMADALGDQSDADSEPEKEMDDLLEREEKEEKSVRGSVY